MSKRKLGPAMKAFLQKKERVAGECMLEGCTKLSVTKRSKWCAEHKKEIRTAQLASNNKVWRVRVEKGTATHHVVYRTKPTQWTVGHASAAAKLVKAGKSVVDPETFEKKVLPKIEQLKKKQA